MFSKTTFRLILVVACVAGLVVGLSHTGLSPIGGDPEMMYQPIKAELARSLIVGQLPFWSDRLGLGTPLVAESHVAAFYPPNWLLYRLWNVRTAYRLAMWLHWLALAAATFAYGRVLQLSRAGAALAAISFTLCGFQAVHALHEPLYHVMPYLPLCLLLANRYVMTARLVWLAGLALAWGTQLTLGHFQIQMWTAGLVLLFGSWQALANDGSRYTQIARVAGLCLGLVWGAMIAWVQLQLTWELSSFTGFARPSYLLADFWFPAAHWAQFALPEVFLGRARGAGDLYWNRYHTIPAEACAYSGIMVWILAFVGALAKPGSSGLSPWRWIAPLSLALATMPGWWPDGFLLLMRLPGLGWSRAPARYTLLTSLGLALLAGRGLDHTVTRGRFWTGLCLAIFAGACAWAWSVYWATGAGFQSNVLAETAWIRFGTAGLFWIGGLAAIVAWRRYWLGAWAPLSLSFLELGVLFFLGPVSWGRPAPLPESSSVLRRLAELPSVGLVGGRLNNLPVVAGKTTAYPYLGINPPSPNYMLEAATSTPDDLSPVDKRWLRRFGVTHEVWGSADSVRGAMLVDRIPDPVLDQVMDSYPISRRGGLGPWKLVQLSDVFPPAWIAREAREAPSWKALFVVLSFEEARNQAWFEPGDLPPSFSATDSLAATVQSWDGKTAIVEHSGPCILILRRTFYPGWVCQVDGGPVQPVRRVNAGLQAVALVGAGTNRIIFQYHPTGLTRATAISIAALAAAIIVLVVSGIIGPYFRSRKRRIQ